MDPTSDKNIEVDDLEEIVIGGDLASLRRFLTLLHPADLAILFATLDRDHWPRVIHSLKVAEISDLMEELPDQLRDDLAELLSHEQLVDIFEEMASDDAADVIADLPEPLAEKVLASIPPEDRVEVETLLGYPEDSAGGLMQMELVSVRETATVQEAIESIRAAAGEVEDLHMVYVMDDAGRVCGLLPLDRLILASPTAPVSSVADRDIRTVRPEVDQEEVAQMFKRYDLVSMAVVDGEGRLLGRILHDDVVDVIEEEAEEDMLRMAGAEEPELIYSNRVFRIASVRIPWLLATIGGGLLSGALLWQFKVSFPQMLALLTFVPVIAAMGGNIGSQSSTIVVRGFATGRIDFHNLSQFLLRELAIGLIMGFFCGLVLTLTARIWHGDYLLALTAGLSMALAITASAITGVLVPFLFRSIRVDPAIAAGPLVTTANDVLGLAIYFSIAWLLIG
ncbi:MAG: magnesium transporter [Deltaproteobacteria bacterium]|nr:magnesium transporter [Deltaproteobacteria bacterium]